MFERPYLKLIKPRIEEPRKFIQKIDNWSEIVKQQWDKDTRENINIKVILLGSSRLLIQKGLTESLAGRFETLYLGHWSYTEMQEAFGWNIQLSIFRTDSFIYKNHWTTSRCRKHNNSGQLLEAAF